MNLYTEFPLDESLLIRGVIVKRTFERYIGTYVTEKKIKDKTANEAVRSAVTHQVFLRQLMTF